MCMYLIYKRILEIGISLLLRFLDYIRGLVSSNYQENIHFFTYCVQVYRIFGDEMSI